MAKYCKYCGSSLKEKAKFCPKCGKVQDDGVLMRQNIQPPIQIDNREKIMQPNNYEHNHKSSNNKSIIIALIGVIIFLVASGVGFYVYQSRGNIDSAKNNMEQSQDTQNNPKQLDSSTQDDTSLSKMVKEKDDIDVAIGEVAGKVNVYISQHPNFQAAVALKSEVKTLLDRTRNAEQQTKTLKVNDTAKRDALVHLFTLEEGRIQGLYKGMLDSSNGGDYSFGFQNGTKNSYDFDAANSKFNQNYK